MNNKYYRYAIIGRNGKMSQFHKNRKAFTGGLLCGKEEIVYSVKLEECREDIHDLVAWRDTNSNDINFIFRTRLQLSTCFTYGVDTEIKKGRGEIVYLKIISSEPCSTAGELEMHLPDWDKL